MSVAEVIDNARSQGRTLLTEVESKQVLHEAGIPVALAVFAPNSRAAVQAAEKAGFPVVMKVVSPDVAHKSDVGGVRSEEHTSELQSRLHLVCRLLLEKKKNQEASAVIDRLNAADKYV